MRKPYAIQENEGEDPDKDYSYYSDKGYSYYLDKDYSKYSYEAYSHNSDKGYSYYSDKDYSKYSYEAYSHNSDKDYSKYSYKAYSYYSVKENEIVGLDEDLDQIKDPLIYGSQMQLRALSIVGMGGIGKTTLARRLFNHPSIVHHFHVCLWVTVSQDYQVRKMLRSLLKGLHEFKSDDVLFKRDDAGLGEALYKKLKGRRYLIVMDDVWSTEALDEVRMYFPNDENRSRILLTTRLVNVATYLNSEVCHHLNFLSTEDSFELLHKKVFGKEEFPSDLEQIGRKIVRECQGLPLAISVVAGILRKISMTPECWEKVAESVASHLTENSKACLDIIGLSYNHLPSHLKACFLYMGAFPADSEIPYQKLIRLWIAEGFLDTSEIINPEEVAEEWLEDLMERHLILVRKGSLGRIRTCHMHDLLREFCLREAKLQNFLHNYPDLDASAHEGTQYHTRVILHPCNHPYNLSAPHIYSLLSHHENLYEDFFLKHRHFKLLTVLDFYVSHFHFFPSEIAQLVNLRYLGLSVKEMLPSLISNLQKLQVLILNYGLEGTLLTQEIWKLSQLRHLQCNDFCILPDPSTPENAGKGLLGLYNLQTLSKLSLCSCSMHVISALPNLKKLWICEIDEADKIGSYWHSCNLNSDNYGSMSTSNNLRVNLSNLGKLHQLESLKLTFLDTFSIEPTRIPHLDSLPQNIKKLTLSFSYLPWEYMNILCMLPNLEVLKLRSYAFIGQEWEQHEEGFQRLKLLLIETTDLEHWESSSDHFPCLEHLILKFCKRLQSIPLDFGAIPTLKVIELHRCSHFAAQSAEEIQLEQNSLGNDALDVHIIMTDFLYDQHHSEAKSMSSVSAIPHPSDLHQEGTLASVSAIPHSSDHDKPDKLHQAHDCGRTHKGIVDTIIRTLDTRYFDSMILALVALEIWAVYQYSLSWNFKKLIFLKLIVLLIWRISRK